VQSVEMSGTIACELCAQLLQQLHSSLGQMEVAPLLAACHLSRPGAPWRQCKLGWHGMYPDSAQRSLDEEAVRTCC
jgi:hypothetical protein